MPEMPESTEHIDESGNVFVTNYYGEAVGQMLDAPTLVYTDAHWAIEKAIEIDNADVRTIIPNAEAILAFLNEHAYGTAEEAEVLYNMNESPVVTTTTPTTASPQRRSWR